jgi:predicted nucleic acid-binding Zn ribbon protein
LLCSVITGATHQIKFKYCSAYFQFDKRLFEQEIYISKKKPLIPEKGRKFKFLNQSQTTYIYPHYHCAKCDAIIEQGTQYSKKLVGEKGYPGWDYFCSKECAVVLIKEEKSKKRGKYWMILLIGVYIAIMVILFTLVFK